MSTRAYKVIKIEYEKEPTFNFRDEGADEVLDCAVYITRNDDNEIREVELEMDDLRSRLEDKESGLSKEAKKLIKKIIKEADSSEFVNYYCF